MSEYSFPRLCDRCNTLRQRDEFYWHFNSVGKWRPRHICKPCYVAQNRAYRKKHTLKPRGPIVLSDPAVIWLTRPMINDTWENRYAYAADLV